MLLSEKKRRKRRRSLKMSRTYDLELSCGCLIGTEDDIYMPCMTDECVADKEYFKKESE